MFNALVAIPRPKTLMKLVSGLIGVLQPVLGVKFVCFVHIQACSVSHGAKYISVVLKNIILPPYPALSFSMARVFFEMYEENITFHLLRKLLDIRFPMVLMNDRLVFIVLLEEAKYVNCLMGTSLWTILRRRIPALPQEVHLPSSVSSRFSWPRNAHFKAWTSVHIHPNLLTSTPVDKVEAGNQYLILRRNSLMMLSCIDQRLIFMMAVGMGDKILSMTDTVQKPRRFRKEYYRVYFCRVGYRMSIRSLVDNMATDI